MYNKNHIPKKKTSSKLYLKHISNTYTYTYGLYRCIEYNNNDYVFQDLTIHKYMYT